MASATPCIPHFELIGQRLSHICTSNLRFSNILSASLCAATSYFSDISTCSSTRPLAMLLPIGSLRHSHRNTPCSIDRKDKWLLVNQRINSCSRFLCHQTDFCFLVKITLNPEVRCKKSSRICRANASAEETGFTDSNPILEGELNRLDLLERIIGNSTEGKDRGSIRCQLQELAEKYDLEGSEVTIPLGASKKTPFRPLTLSQKRNIRRQEYLDEVAKRNDAPFFAAIGAFILLPPVIVLGVAIASGYVNVLP